MSVRACLGRAVHKQQLIRPEGYGALLLVLIASAVFVWQTFGYGFVLGTTPYWQAQVQDVTQYIAGFNMYFSAPWQLPLLAFDSLNYPVGTRVTFVDAIPLYALLLKLFLPSSLPPFNPFGFWVALCFVLQGVGAWWICRELKTKSWIFLGVLAIFCLMYPALMARLGHISLMSHWILLFSLALYIRGYRQMGLPVWGWTLLLVSAFYINVYLFVMACGIYGAALLSLRRRLVIKDVGSFGIPFLALAASTVAMLFPLPPSQVTREWGFGYFSMNLLSPFVGGKFLDWQVPEVPGQYEGFNYLGLGVLTGLLLAYFFRNRPGNDILSRHGALLTLCIIFSVYALSSQVYFGGERVLVVAYPGELEGLTAQFRASGRFFWPVGYCLAIFSLLMLNRGLGKSAFVLVAVALAILQVADLNNVYKSLRANVLRGDVDQPLDVKLWDSSLNDRVKVLYFYPKFKCGKDSNQTLLPVMQYAAARRLKLNTGYIARYTPDCQDVQAEIAGSNPNDSAYVFVRQDYPTLGGIKLLFAEHSDIQCKQVQFAYICLNVSEGER